MIKILLLALMFSYEFDLVFGENVTRILHREKRIVFPFNSATGILCALSIPLVIPERNIFMSYNFEMNYGMPIDSTDYTQGALKRIDTTEINSRVLKEERALHAVRRSAMLTRKKVYRSIEIQLNKTGLNGKRCILRAICEASELPAYEHNGVIGDLLQILLTPSHSEDENLPLEFYRAEFMGHQRDCSKYRRHCPTSILNMISILL